MPRAGRVGDHGKYADHEAEGPAKQGSPDVFINGKAALRVGDPGNQSCPKCGKGKWQAKKGSPGVLINGIPAHRLGDATDHCGTGQLIEGSPDVTIGDRGGGESKPIPHDRTLEVKAVDGLGRQLKDAVVRMTCPHKPDFEQKFTGITTLTGLCSAATVSVHKAIQKGEWDVGAVSGNLLSPTHSVKPGDAA
jgi:uncharacterized Zn-binding protein involved in type VI secretion